MDKPDNDRKVHRKPVPRIGGIPIILAYVVAVGLLVSGPFTAGHSVAEAFPLALRLMPALLLVFVTGLADDTFGLKPWHKLAVEIVAAASVCHAGVQISAIAAYSLPHYIGVALTIIWLVACTNAFNLIDGLDGLAVGLGLFAAVTVAVNAILCGNYVLALATAPLIGALLGFLPYNFNPASIFMGDCGSLTVGFLLGCFGIIWSQKSATLLGMTAPLIALAIPLLDTALAIARRFLRQRPVFSPDRGHIHHRLLARGLTPRRVAYVFYAFAGILAGLSVLLGSAANQIAGAGLVAFCAVVWWAVQYLGYEEFDAARRMVFGGLFRRVLNGNLSVRELEAAVHRANSLDECWVALVATGRSFGFSEASLQYHDRQFTARLAEGESAEYWGLQIPLNHSGHVHLRAPLPCGHPPETIGLLVTTVATIFAGRLAAFPGHSTTLCVDPPEHQQLTPLAWWAAVVSGA